jgi:outer membrane protein assembly factor BamA
LPKAGTPRDREVVRAGQDLGVHLLRDNGYAHAAVTVVEQPLAQPNRVGLRLHADPGPKSYFGEIAIAGLVSVDEHVVRRELDFASGDLYRESALTRSQQQLTNLELFEFAHVDPRVEDDQATQIPVRVTLAESKTKRLKLGVGLGSEERVRGSLEWKHLNLFGRAQQMTTTAKYSYLERGVRFSFLQPYVFRKELSLNVTGTAWHTSELTYETGTYGGRATLTYHQDAPRSGGRKPVHHEFRLAYVNEYVRYGITDESLDDQSRRAERIALGLDPDTGKGAGTVGAIEFGLERIATDVPPIRIGEYVRTALSRPRAGRHLWNCRPGASIALRPARRLPNRVQVGAVIADTPTDMPFSERYFLGGPRASQLGPFSQPALASGLPVSGLSMAGGRADRFPVTERSAPSFLDAGNVWAGSRVFEVTGLRYAIGPGVRYLTPVGAIRADVGLQLNRIPGLVVDGKPESRQWRLHFSIGQSF